jgi:hypothetical protein
MFPMMTFNKVLGLVPISPHMIIIDHPYSNDLPGYNMLGYVISQVG